ncbi:MAG: anthranilate synthase component I family protein [Planctomycetes bacterium]|nr:anthranilate synthase component I family protein [Planctomycetota bacterium]
MTRSCPESDPPIARRLAAGLDPVACFRKMLAMPHCLFLDSALRRPRLGRYSFLTADPFAWVELPVGDRAAPAAIDRAIRPFRAEHRPDLPPFQGGAAGLFAYDLLHAFEDVPRARFDEFEIPAVVIGLYDVVVAFDHDTGATWLISQGFPETEPTRRARRAARRLDEFQERVLGSQAPVWTPSTRSSRSSSRDRAPAFPTDRGPGITSNFPRQGYLDAVERVVEYIRAGDAFQVNLAQRLLCRATGSAHALYLRMRERNPATFAAYFDAGSFQIAGASPERFLRVQGRRVEARPIKGTRPRSTFAEASLFAADDLLASEKDRAENVMIVDLLRNDLSKVCEPDSIRVTELCRIEAYEYVHHLVSAVEGTLRPGVEPLDLLPAAFPGGSITGAPKVRAMEIIAELEPTARGAYCGSLGYVGFDGCLDLNILIRTITARDGWWQMQVGGGITAQSNAERELDETWQKAVGLIKSLTP